MLISHKKKDKKHLLIPLRTLKIWKKILVQKSDLDNPEKKFKKIIFEIRLFVFEYLTSTGRQISSKNSFTFVEKIIKNFVETFFQTNTGLVI